MWKNWPCAGAECFYLGNVGYMVASVTTGVILLSTEAIFTALGGVWALGEKLPVRSIVAIVDQHGGSSLDECGGSGECDSCRADGLAA